jgi:anti-anti-sigma factor
MIAGIIDPLLLWRREMAVVQISQAQGRVPVTIFRLQDRVNLGNFTELEETARESYNKGTHDIVLDLSQTVSLTSIGIRAIVIIHKMLSTDGGKHLKIANPMPYIREMLDISGVTQYIEIYNTVDEAVASF